MLQGPFYEFPDYGTNAQQSFRKTNDTCLYFPIVNPSLVNTFGYSIAI